MEPRDYYPSFETRFIILIIAVFAFSCVIIPNTVFDAFTYLSNCDLRERGWNVSAVVWMVGITIYGSYKYFCHFLDNEIKLKQIGNENVELKKTGKDVHMYSALFLSICIGVFTALFYYLVIDEISNTLYVLSRQNVVAAVNQLLLIPDKYIRWFALIPLCTILVFYYARRYINFKPMIFATVILLCINVVQMSLGVFDLRGLEYPLKTWVYITNFIPVYAMLGIGYFYFWKKE
jgi:hypothetical protein